jgi:redox-sensitive bicupin YhaK (pirin superfamily)
MLTVRKASERGASNLGWLESYHTFSFSDYHDPRWMGFHALRVINDDTVAAGGGFGTHAHRDMEIITYVLEGALEHKDSIGTGSIIRPGDVQKMSAGSGIRHSEFNASDKEAVHFLQIWVIPDRQGIQPAYEQLHFPREAKLGKLLLVGSNSGEAGVIRLQQDAKMYVTVLDSAEQKVDHTLASGRHAWVQVATGSATVNGQKLERGDGAAIESESKIEISGAPEAEVIVFDLG